MKKPVLFLGKPTIIYSMDDLSEYMAIVEKLHQNHTGAAHRLFLDYGYDHIYDEETGLTHMPGSPGLQTELISEYKDGVFTDKC